MPDVGGDRLQHLGRARRQDQVVPAEAQLQPRRELAERAARGAARAEVEILAAGLPRPAEAATTLATSAARSIWPIESRNLAATSSTSVGARGAAPGGAPLRERGLGHLDDDRRQVGQRERGLRACGRTGRRARRRLASQRCIARAGARLELLDAAERDEAAPRARRSAPPRAGARAIAAPRPRRRARAAARRPPPRCAAASGPATSSGTGVLEREHGRELARRDCARPSASPSARTTSMRQVRRGVGEVDAEQEADEPLGGLGAALGERHGRVGVGDAQRAARAQPAAAVEAREHVARRRSRRPRAAVRRGAGWAGGRVRSSCR